MQTSERGKVFIAAHEGIVLRAYRDVAGVWTIGVGHTARAGGIRPKAGMTITREQALAQLEQDLRRFERRVEKTGAFKVQHAFDGAVSFDFNTGSIHRATWVRKWRKGLFASAEMSLMLWVKAGGRTWPGLMTRRKAEADLIFRGNYGAHAGQAVDTARHEAVSSPPAEPSAEVREAQEILTTKGFNPGAIDGWMGKKTRAAVIAYQRAHPDLANDGVLGPATLAQLRRDAAAVRNTAIRGGGGGGIGALVTGAGSLFAGLPWNWIAAGVLVVALAYFAWSYRDVIQRRVNTALGRTVEVE